MLQKCFHETIKFFLVFIVKEEKEKPILCEMHIFWSEKRHLCLQYQAKIAALLVVRILLYSIENRPFLCFIICIKMKNSPPIPTHSPHVYEFKAALEVNCCLKLTYVHTWFPDVSFLTSNKLKMYVLNVIFVLGTIERKPILASKYWSQRKKHFFFWLKNTPYQTKESFSFQYIWGNCSIKFTFNMSKEITCLVKNALLHNYTSSCA